MQDMEKCLASKARDHRSVSFNGVSVMVDTALKWSMIPKEQQSQLSAAIDQNKIEIIRLEIYIELSNVIIFDEKSLIDLQSVVSRGIAFNKLKTFSGDKPAWEPRIWRLHFRLPWKRSIRYIRFFLKIYHFTG